MQQQHNSAKSLTLTNPMPEGMLGLVLNLANSSTQQIGRKAQIERWARGFVPKPTQLRLIS